MSSESKTHEAGEFDDVARDERLVGVLEQTGQAPRLGGRPVGVVDLGDARGGAQVGDEIGDRRVGHGDPERQAVEASRHAREDESGGPGRAGRCRHDVDGRAARPSRILVQRVDETLVTGVGVHGRHEPVLDAEGVVEHLGQEGQAVRRARGVGDDEVSLPDRTDPRSPRRRRSRRDRRRVRRSRRGSRRLRGARLAFSRLVYFPVDSTTTSIPSSSHGSAFASGSASIAMRRAPTIIVSPSTLTGSG